MGIKEDLKIPISMLSIGFLNKLKYKGSYKGKRFMFEKSEKEVDDNTNNIDNTDNIDNIKEKKTKTILNVYVWDDKFNFENTPKDEIEKKEFEFTKEGIDEGLKYVEETLEVH